LLFALTPTRLKNQAIGAVASNNIVAIRGDRDLLDSLKRLKGIDNVVLTEKLNPSQQEAILVNRALVLCLLNKVRGCYQQLPAFCVHRLSHTCI
jgi:hypothetical protein